METRNARHFTFKMGRIIVFKKEMGKSKCIWSDSLGNFIVIPLINGAVVYKGDMFVRSDDLYFLRKINDNHLAPSFVVNEFDHDKLVKSIYFNMATG